MRAKSAADDVDGARSCRARESMMRPWCPSSSGHGGE